MDLEQIKKLKYDMLHPNFLNHITTFKIDNIHGDINGKELYLELYKALEELERLKSENK